MRALMMVFVLGLLWASPASSQNADSCQSGLRIPIRYQIVPPICPNEPLQLMARTCGPCVDLQGWTYMPPGPIQIHATMTLASCIATVVCEPESLLVPMGSFAPGHHVVALELRGTVIRSDGSTCTLVQMEHLAFDVPSQCPPGPLPYTDLIRVGPPPPCNTCPAPPICPNVEIPFFIAGTFPDNCYQFRGIELLPSPIMSPLPQPPVVRVYVAYNDCLGMPCVLMPVHWEAGAMLPPLPSMPYHLIVEMAMVSWCDSTRTPDTLYTTLVPFTVAESCSTPPSPACFLYGWQPHPSRADCDAFVGNGTPGRVTMQMFTGTVLAGLQGRLALDPPSLEIAGLRPVGLAADMNIAWTRQSDGASFMLFSVDGHTMRSPCIPPAMCPPGFDPVLEVTVAPRPGVPIPPLTLLQAASLMAADTLGHEVPQCPTFAPIGPARICAGRSCDFNADGHLDIRDLVLMARCVMGRGPCPDSAASRFDCDGDGSLGVGDVWCCARVILQGRMPAGVTARSAPGVRTSVGIPAVTAAGVDLPIRISGADLVGAARLAISYPAVAFSGAQVELLGDASGWIEVDELGTGELVVGLVATTPAEQTPGQLDLVVHLSVAPGQAPSSNVQLANVEFVGTDGEPLAVSAPVLDVPDGAPRIRLSAARPNPFSRETRFTLTLAEPVDVDVAVFDLVGRRVASLHHGVLPAGDHTFLWSGAGRDGKGVPDGIYFYRIAGGGASLTRRIVRITGP